MYLILPEFSLLTSMSVVNLFRTEKFLRIYQSAADTDGDTTL